MQILEIYKITVNKFIDFFREEIQVLYNIYCLETVQVDKSVPHCPKFRQQRFHTYRLQVLSYSTDDCVFLSLTSAQSHE